MRLLDLGAAGGHLGRAVRDRCLFLAGVEPHPPDDSGEERLRRLARRSMPSTPESGSELFDVVVCADVLEHFYQARGAASEDPGLAERPGGLLLTSIPNIANVSMRLSLLAGQFNYADRGLLDRTAPDLLYPLDREGPPRKEGFRIRAVGSDGDAVRAGRPSLSRPPWIGPLRSARARDRPRRGRRCSATSSCSKP